MDSDKEMDFDKELKERIGIINGIIAKYLPEENGLQRTAAEAMNYSVEAGGKRLRPMLMMESWKLFGGTGEVIEPFMAAIEMIHTYSLVHDDLPAMDNDEYRRGRKSTHAAFGEAMGILAGDALLNWAFEIMAGAVEKNCVQSTARAMRIIAEKAGLYGMIGGQVVDIESEGKEISQDILEYLQEKKTAALIEAALMAGATLAGADEADVERMERIGSDIGLAFQIQDDILDVTSTMEMLGKPIGSDEKNGKVTYVSFAGLEDAKRKVEELSDRAERNLRETGRENLFLEELIGYLVNRKS